MACFKDSEQLYKVHGELVKRMLADSSVGPKLARVKGNIRLDYADPEAGMLLNCSDPAPAMRPTSLMYTHVPKHSGCGGVIID